ncbi:MAG: Helix-turn-helix domain protein [Candidatus Falkowbacteria bacterium GW2011_GWC2_38_22]|uniref:Helix-turn-helix domain protein n=1 Tax=Candidatus Falkowbacteria bacterium GW2011_GWE1_38_31 TaxID=1618638 RepID=A0A0G0K697_9BACT|nr:MAG: Helix-turn-helix domain protein [Candidatus Falkowbacteria bacterium GW2011_GWF2_38_1205]KKQ62155.1 MAG: Helix-turn-helix domain protein [Candidatus Falkowbacteria bacterium GW2011_GWC2_38_22]KKQ64305.1 MAG: Helix-turn-helix domain protein [Candidatus Falkowbacteria bacterium GW2011_GWF1_38_22]KKQ66282.1 MAG: Helix-turn-helix domain protein [Candidatus Falkowbacteria bacterium GW2011_GWE2_38_254]KKQ71010.1 MAG: Helix-turn-helix domain protein [Candidatus Falkowbacteria bacterium GW2011_
MEKKTNNFGAILKEFRFKKNLSLREVCKEIGYDPSNWSKIERGVLAPPTDLNTLHKWALTLGLKKGDSAYQDFIDQANISQGIIPEDILAQKNLVKSLPAFFRTIRNDKPSKEEIDTLIKLIRNS